MNVAKRFADGLTRTANITILTVVVAASILTFDWLLLKVGLAVESIYLLGYVFWPASFRRPAEPVAAPDSGAESLNREPLKRLTRYFLAPPDRRRVEFLDGVLVVVTVLGFVVIAFFGFGKHLLSNPWPYLTHAEGWDLGALIWTGFFLLYYTWKFPLTNVRMVDKAIISIIGWGSLPLIFAAALTMKQPIWHVFYVWLIGVVFFSIDLLLWKRHPTHEERELSRTSLIWADTPMVVAFFVLLLYLLFHRDTEHEVFVSGIVSCQLLISNAVFIVTEFGLLRSPEFSGGETPGPNKAAQGG
jgi:hypothetical protein